MLDEEYVKREKRAAEGYERYFDSRPGMSEEIDELYVLLNEKKITPEELRKRALEIGKKYS
ncbi:hypothetical protein [uncultured Granulicatella sp.]|uniref:hypothetical protein n=1 Tax=uncultured Granulicatella sp. TaxID=316089 RepID=UPI0028D90C86|nr:hypothetical protein [uncultured Granulicatella sp.]